MPVFLRGLTWNHARATSALYAAREPLRQALPDVELTWEVQPLSGFEARPIAEAAQWYDLVIFDHPHVGEIAARGLFHPVDASLSALGLTDEDFVGPTLASYRYANQAWGFPLDAACQVSCARSDLLDELGVQAPQRWTQVFELGEAARHRDWRLAIAFHGVHALMTFLSLCANQKAPLGDRLDGAAFPHPEIAADSLAQMKALLRYCAPEVLDWDSIALQEAMSRRDDLVYCPLVYGFVPYAKPARPRRLSYGPFPGVAGVDGSTLGGAGLGISAFCTQPGAAFAVAGFLIDAAVQETLIAVHDGQPARRSSWDSAVTDQHSSGFYSQTRTTLECAWIRPRFDGYLDFQRHGGLTVESYLRGVLSI